MPVEIIKHNKKMALESPFHKKLELDTTLSVEGAAAEAAAVGEALSQVGQADFEAKQNEKGHILNRPMNRTINYTNTIESFAIGAYCVYDFRSYPGSTYKNYLTLEALENDTNDISFSFTYEMKGSTGWRTVSLNTKAIKSLDSANLSLAMNISANRKTDLYIVHNYTLLSEELKAQIAYNGIWVVVTGADAEVNMRNLVLTQYYYTKIDSHYLPANTVMTKQLESYVDNALANVPTGGNSAEVWETITEATVEDVVLTELACNFDDYRKVAIMLDGFGTKTAGKVNAHFGYADSDTTKQICQFIGTTDDKRYGYILIDTVLGQIVYTANTNWAQAGCNLMTLPDSLSARNYIGATKVKIIAIDSNGGGANPSASNTMMGKIKIVGVRK